MKNAALFLSILLLLGAGVGVSAQKKQGKAGNGPVKVYYFHNNHRCATCMAVESKTRAALEELYPAQMKAGKVSFTAINGESSSGKAEAEGLGIKGQCLMVVKDGKKTDLTDKAFMYCKVSPEKLKAALHDAIGDL
ncbi:MAG TPA: nitrophenyl compound nitroreductase subunit ArsF family protein [Bacteroidales bacterium]|nr:nitrophenyl compound nitroreductase subunit ArsF family protein [Bacteroidales bacterium]HRZ76403.1 nitrophenyl compound nitroreductase subunit ArsF family protein [Bacteroidales bacterium]